jgi:glycosyltransferase involved in cell wall biosynthesis
MRVTLITPGITPYVIGGLQRHSFNLVKGLAQLGIKVDLYHTDFADAIDINQLAGITGIEKVNIRSIAIPWIEADRLPGHYVRSLKYFSNEAYRLYQQQPASDFVLGKSLAAWAFTTAKRRGEKLPPIGVNLHGFEMFQAPANLKARLESWMLRPPFSYHAHQADYLFSYGGRITELIQDRLHISHDKILEIPGGIDSAWLVDEAKLPLSQLRFVFVGRYERRKGIEELHAAIQGKTDWINCATFRFIGPIPEDKRLSLPNVSYSGPIHDEVLLKDELRQADVLLCPSHSEGMPNVILEGMASGLAVLATDVGAVRLLVDSKNGVLLPKINIPNLVGSINRLLHQGQGQIMAMKQASLVRVRSFTWDKVAAQTLSQIQKIAAKV